MGSKYILLTRISLRMILSVIKFFFINMLVSLLTFLYRKFFILVSDQASMKVVESLKGKPFSALDPSIFDSVKTGFIISATNLGEAIEFVVIEIGLHEL